MTFKQLDDEIQDTDRIQHTDEAAKKAAEQAQKAAESVRPNKPSIKSASENCG
jgi:hypothetical protein